MSQSSSAASDGSTSEIRQHHSDRRSSTPEYESRLPDLTDRQVNPHPEIQNDTGASPLAVLSTAPDAGVTTLPSGQAVATPVLLDLSESLNSKVKSIKTAKATGWSIPSPNASSPINSVRSTTRKAISGKHYTSESDSEKTASKQISRHSRNKHDDNHRNSDRSSTHRNSRHSSNNEHSNRRHTLVKVVDTNSILLVYYLYSGY
jgi:hypothetical protein